MTATSLVEKTRVGTGESALVGLFDHQNRVLLARTTARQHVWQPVGGHVEAWDTDPGDTVVREVHEETGVLLDRSMLWPVAVYPSDTGEGRIHFYLAQLAARPLLRMQEDEIVELRWFTPSEAVGLPALPATRAFLAELL